MESGISVADDPAAATPERALVFEVIGPVANFARAARELGFDWLAEDYLPDPEEGEDEDDSSDDTGTSRLYLTMPSLEGLRRLLGYWRAYTQGRRRPDEARAWWALFGYLSDVRVWSAKDRLDPSLIRYITLTLDSDPMRPVRMEVDLWFRHDEDARQKAADSLKEILRVVGGEFLDFALIEEIEYQTALISVPAEAARDLANMVGPLAEADMVMAVRPQSLFEWDVPSDSLTEGGSWTPLGEPDARPAIAALLDGYPIQNHALLRNRVDVTEVDISGEDVPIERRFHGTAMASLIQHGDLSNGQDSIGRTLIVVPILAAPQGANGETTPPDKLPLAMVYNAIIALKEGFDDSAPAGPDVVIINHSVCDMQAPFVRRPSAWAKLIDYLSHEYGILFVVSAGNIRTPITLDAYPDRQSFIDADPIERQITILRAIEAAKGTRGILSPAEAVNAITVGAIHADGAGACPDHHVDPYAEIGMTNLCSAVGLGVNRSVKPDMINDGGRQVAASSDANPGVVIWGDEIGHLGQLAASPDVHSGDLSYTRRSTGTSNAAALTTRSGIRIADALEAVVSNNGERWQELPTRAVMLKALLAHSCEWGEVGGLLDAAYPPFDRNGWHRRREAITRFLGFGKPNSTRVVDGESHRVTLLGDDIIAAEALHEYRIPLPAAMVRNREVRRITMTLAWCTPIRPRSTAYRGVAVDIVDKEGKKDFWKGVKKALQPLPVVSRRGTLFHMVLEGKNLADFTDPAGLFVGVQARALHDEFAEARVPYALAITLEIAQSLRADIYNEVRTKVRARPVVRTRTRTKA